MIPLAHQCPGCGQQFSAASNVKDTLAPIEPKAGDVTVCIGCSAVLVFEPDLSLHLITAKERRALPAKTLAGVNWIRWLLQQRS